MAVWNLEPGREAAGTPGGVIRPLGPMWDGGQRDARPSDRAVGDTESADEPAEEPSMGHAEEETDG
jgi:hypothetical protein